MIAATSDELGGFAGIVLALLILVVACLWIVFPILVLTKFNDLLEAQRAIHRALLAANTVREEIAKALQWMVNNWRDDSKPPPPSG
jgi:HAMP domain-containing protein